MSKEKILELVEEIVDLILEGAESDPSDGDAPETPKEPRKVFNCNEPPASKVEIEKFQKQWDAMEDDEHADYLEGKIDSKCNEIEGGAEKSKPAKTTKKSDDGEITSANIMTAMKKYADKMGREKSIKLLIKYGADKKKPKVNQIPEESYKKLVDAIKRALKK